LVTNFLITHHCVIQRVACSEVIYVRLTVNSQHSLHQQTLLLVCSSVLMLHPHHLEQSSFICTHRWQFH